MWKKSSHSAYNGSCVEVSYGKSSHSGNTDCVEAGQGACGLVHVRDSKDPSGPSLAFAPAEWRAFLEGLGGAGGSSPGTSTA